MLHLYTCIIPGSQEEEELYLCLEPEDQQTQPTQEVQAQEENPEELPECPDHHPSVFEQGKPRSIPNPNFFKCRNLFTTIICIAALSVRS